MSGGRSGLPDHVSNEGPVTSHLQRRTTCWGAFPSGDGRLQPGGEASGRLEHQLVAPPGGAIELHQILGLDRTC